MAYNLHRLCELTLLPLDCCVLLLTLLLIFVTGALSQRQVEKYVCKPHEDNSTQTEYLTTLNRLLSSKALEKAIISEN